MKKLSFCTSAGIADPYGPLLGTTLPGKAPPRILTEPLPKIGKVAYFLGYHYTPPCIGEAGVPVIAPAIANAVSQLTGGKRLRQLPMLPNRVQAALRAA